MHCFWGVSIGISDRPCLRSISRGSVGFSTPDVDTRRIVELCIYTGQTSDNESVEQHIVRLAYSAQPAWWAHYIHVAHLSISHSFARWHLPPLASHRFRRTARLHALLREGKRFRDCARIKVDLHDSLGTSSPRRRGSFTPAYLGHLSRCPTYHYDNHDVPSTMVPCHQPSARYPSDGTRLSPRWGIPLPQHHRLQDSSTSGGISGRGER